MEQELAYSFHLGSDKNKSKLAKKVSKENVSGTTSFSNNAIQNAKDLSDVNKHNLRYFDNQTELIRTIYGTSDIVNDVKQVYWDEFEQARIEYNNKQTREDRKIEDYFKKVCDSQNDIACEIIIELGDMDFWNDKDERYRFKMVDVYNEQVKDLIKIIPDFKIANATIHFDEVSPHMHIVGVPVSYDCKRGMKKQVVKSKLFTSLFAILLILSFCMAKPAQVHASKAESAKMARWMSICSSMADNIEKKHFVYSNGGTARTYNSAVKRSRRSNCALYVSWCLQKYGALGSGQTFYIRRGSSSIRKNFGHWKKKKVQVIRVNKRASRVNLKKGDVVLWSGLGHTNIYAGKNSSGERLWFDAGKAATYGHHSGSRFNNIGKKTQGYLNSKTVSYIIRIKGL